MEPAVPDLMQELSRYLSSCSPAARLGSICTVTLLTTACTQVGFLLSEPRRVWL